jgi:hypothetical protein
MDGEPGGGAPRPGERAPLPGLAEVREISYWTFHVLVGATFQVAPGARLRAGIAENDLTPTRGADITGLLEASFSF